MAIGGRGGTAFAGLLVAACTVPNPAFFAGADDGGPGSSGGPGSTGEGSTSAVAGTTGEATSTGETGATSPGETSSGGETTAAIDETSTGGAHDTSSGSTSTTDGTTGEPLEATVEFEAEVATCVLTALQLQPHLGPSQCEQRASDAAGLVSGAMIVDASFKEKGGSRPGLVFLRFVLPPELAGATVTAATLKLGVADAKGADSTSAGVLRFAAPFDAAALETTAPGALPGFEHAIGGVQQGQPLLVALPEAAIDPGAPVHLGIWPSSDDGAVFLSNAAAMGRPRLVLSYLQ